MAANQVLIVDKLATHREQIRAMLPAGNFQELEAATGEEAISLLESDGHGIRVIVFNFDLPAPSGWELLKTLQSSARLQKIATVTIAEGLELSAIVPPEYFNYIEVVERSCDRRTFQKALKSALGKSKKSRSALPSEPLAPFAPPPPAAEDEPASPVENLPEPSPEASVDPFAIPTSEPVASVDPFAVPASEPAAEPVASVDPFAIPTNEPATANPVAEIPLQPTEVAEAASELEVGEPPPVDEPEAEPAAYAVAPTPYESLECYRTISDRVIRGIDCLTINPNGDCLITGSDSHPIQIWDLATGTVVVQWSLHSRGTHSLAMMPDGQVAISAARTSKVRRWNFLTGELLGALNDAALGVSAIAVTPDGLTLVSGAIDSNIKLWDLTTGQLICPLNDYSFGTTALAMTSDGSILVTGSQKSNIKLWDLSTGELLGPLNSESSRVTCLTIAPDDRLVVSGHEDGTIEFTDLDSGTVLRRLKAHQEPVTGIAITPDGQYAICACHDEIKFWGAGVS